MELTDSQKRIYDVLNRTNLTDRDKAILISQLQEKLVSGENISTINGEDITKGGNIEIQTGSDVVFKGNYDAENNPAATIQDVKDEISEVEPYVINLTNLLAAQDSESISTAIGGIDNLNGTVQKNQVIFGTLANGTVAVGIRVLGNQTTLTYFVDSVVGLTVNEIIITNTSGTLTKTVNTHAVLTENMVINSLNSDETTLPLSAAKGKILNKSIGQPIIEDIDLTTNVENGYFWNVNGTKTANSSWNISDIIALNKGDLLIVNDISASTATSIITTISNTGDFIDSLVAGDGTQKGSYSYIADKDCKVQLSYSSITSAYIVKSSQNKAIVNTAFLHKIYEYYGAVYNDETGYWELNGLTDLTEEDMWDIYLENGAVSFGSNNNDNYILRFWPFRKARIRFIRAEDLEYCNLSAFVFCRNNRKLEVFRCMNESGAEIRLKISGRATGLFFACTNLKDAGMINVSQVNIFIDKNILSFHKCAKLRRVLLMNLKLDISFQDSPLLSYESLNYLITNAANTAAITVTVHPTTYSYLTGTAQPTEEVGGTSEEWQALVTTAQGKQISFAIPEETQSEVTE